LETRKAKLPNSLWKQEKPNNQIVFGNKKTKEPKQDSEMRLRSAIRVITKLPNTEQSSKGKGKTHKSINRYNQSTTGKLGKPQWP
jgi:hypothetical protein